MSFKDSGARAFPEFLKLWSQSKPAWAMDEIWTQPGHHNSIQPAEAICESELTGAEKVPEFAKLVSFKDSGARAFS